MMNSNAFKSTPCDSCPHRDVKPSTPKARVPYIFKYDDTVRLVKLTTEQIALLEYLDNEGMTSSYFSYEEAESADWEEV